MALFVPRMFRVWNWSETGLWVLSSAFVTTKTSEVVTGGAGGSQPPPSTDVSGVWGEFSTVLCLSQKKEKNPEMYLCISSWLFIFTQVGQAY